MNKALLWVAVGVGVLVLLSRRAMAAQVPDTTAGSGPPTMMSGMDKTISGARAAGPIVKTLTKPAFTTQKPLTSNLPTGEVAVDADLDVGQQIQAFGGSVKGVLDTLLGLFETGEQVAAKVGEYLPEGDVYTKE